MSHPATYSRSIVALLGEILVSEWPDWFGRPVLHDPFAGTGTRLDEMARVIEWNCWTGTEIEECFIDPQCASWLTAGDSRDPATYPPARRPAEADTGGWVICTSPPYANGISDSFTPRDDSKRYTYTKAKITLSGNPDATLDEANLGRWGYRGSRRHGRSIRRQTYWGIADACVANWHTASLVLLNVSDFRSGGETEPHVMDWRTLLARHGFTDQLEIPVATPRMRNGANAEERVGTEVIIRARRG